MAIQDGEFWVNKQGKPTHKDLIAVDEVLRDEVVEELIADAFTASTKLSEFKALSLKKMADYFALLLDKYRIDAKAHSKKGNYTLENYSATAKVQIAVSELIQFDEKLSIAKIKIDEFMHEETKDSSANIKTLINKAFEVDKKGDISVKKILELRSYDIKHPLWQEAMHIIGDSIEIASTKNYIRFYTRKSIDEAYSQIQLNISNL